MYYVLCIIIIIIIIIIIGIVLALSVNRTESFLIIEAFYIKCQQRKTSLCSRFKED